MGPQSQRRLTLEQRTHRMQQNCYSSNNNKRKVGQLTLFGERAFEPEKDCEVCKGRLGGREVHRAHHKLCINNKRTKGITSAVTLAQQKIDKSLKQLFSAPLSEEEKASSQHNSKAASDFFFSKRNHTLNKENTTTSMGPTTTISMTADVENTAEMLCKAVTASVNDASFRTGYTKNRAPLAILALAGLVVEKFVRAKDSLELFQGLSMTVPPCESMYDNPHYHSIVGQKLLLVDWKRQYDLDIQCPACGGANLKNDRTNFSKNKTLFPVFGLDGPPSWCMVMSMTCPSCRRRFNANDGEVLAGLPAYAASSYPVETKYALHQKNSHLSRQATEIFDMLLTTYGNGDLCSRLLCNTINRSYIERVASYYSYGVKSQRCCLPYPEKDGVYMTHYPPTGDSIRDAYDEASNSINTPWRISDKQRHTQEIQAVECHRLYAEDHTHQMTKNYFKRRTIGALALWDVATETGEIATAVLVPSTKTKDLSHAAMSLARRPKFAPKAMCSDRRPVKVDYWERVFGSQIEGRLGLFHFTQRIIKTLRKRHIDYFLAINNLLDCVYYYNEDDHEKLLTVHKNGTLNGKKLTDDDIADLKSTRHFRQRHGKHLRKEIRQPNVMRHKLDQWFARFKCTASEDSTLPEQGRLDPVSREPLFTTETKPAVLNCKEKCMYLQDPLPLDEMYDVIIPSQSSPHGLKEYLSRRGESNLESFHLMLAHFGNTGMRESLADNLNLTGTARYNLHVRFKLRLSKAGTNRKKIPSSWETVLGYFNHTELQHINRLANAAGVTQVPFDNTETLQPDNGERFFSEYLSWMKDTKSKTDLNDMCLCTSCQPINKEITQETRAACMPTPRIDAIDAGPSNVSNVAPPPRETAAATTATPTVQIVAQHQMQAWAPTFMAPPLPMWINPYMAPPVAACQHWQMCCRKHSEYCMREDRRGRPPHNIRCRFRRLAVKDNNSIK